MSDSMLPAQFADLEPFAAEWCLPTEGERYAKRVTSSTPELQTFYDAFFPRTQEALDYCDRYQIDELPDDVINLMRLLYSLVTVAAAVETWLQGRIPDTGASEITCLVEPIP
jgi:hypothetical protein